MNDSLSEKLQHESSSSTSCLGRVSYTSSELFNFFSIAANEQWCLHNHEAWNTICHITLMHVSGSVEVIGVGVVVGGNSVEYQ